MTEQEWEEVRVVIAAALDAERKRLASLVQCSVPMKSYYGIPEAEQAVHDFAESLARSLERGE